MGLTQIIGQYLIFGAAHCQITFKTKSSPERNRIKCRVVVGYQVSARHWTSAQTFWSTLLLILSTTTYPAIFTIYPIYNQLPCSRSAFWKKNNNFYGKNDWECVERETVISRRRWPVISILWSVFPCPQHPWQLWSLSKPINILCSWSKLML